MKLNVLNFESVLVTSFFKHNFKMQLNLNNVFLQMSYQDFLALNQAGIGAHDSFQAATDQAVFEEQYQIPTRKKHSIWTEEDGRRYQHIRGNQSCSTNEDDDQYPHKWNDPVH